MARPSSPRPSRPPRSWAALRARADRTTATVREVGERAIEGDRPLLVGLLGLLVLCVVMVAGPLQAYGDGHSRVTLLERKHEALTEEVQRLEERRDLLADPTQVELLAREQQGFVRPGETAYVVVPPTDEPVIQRPQDVEDDPRPWYRRWWDALVGVGA